MRLPFQPVALLISALALVLLTGCESNVERYRKLGISQYNQQQYDASLASVNKALTYNAADPQSNTYAGLLQYRAGNYVQAEYHFRVALQMDPSSEQAKDGITATLIKAGNPDKALDYLERAAQMSQKVKDPRIEKTYTNRVYRKQTEERLFLGKAADCLRIGRAYEQLGDYDNAMVYYKKGLDLQPQSPNVLMAMASLSEKAGNRPAARDYLRQCYLSDPGTPGLVEAMTRNGLAISDVLSVPRPNDAVIPSPK